MTYRIKGLEPETFAHYYGLPDSALAELGIRRYRVDACPGIPDRVQMRDVPVGETALLLNYEHLPTGSPYRSRHAIFVQEGETEVYDQTGVVPEVMQRRVVSLRGFDAEDFIVEADLAEGEEIDRKITAFFENPQVRYIHAHYAKPGCFAARIDRA